MSSNFGSILPRSTTISRTSSIFGQIRIKTAELAALELLKNSHRLSVVSTPSPSFFIGSSSFLQVTRITIKAWMSSNFGSILRRTAELPAIERLKN